MLENKYSKIYHRIISRAKDRTLVEYCESHHIVPKSLGGSNKKENLVNLTAREHFICHLLLTKMYIGKDKDKMIHAAWAMTTLANQYQKRYKINSKVYQILREQYAKTRSKQLLGKPGKKLSEETKKKISNAHLGKKRGPMSAELKKKLSESLKGKNLGKIKSPEQRKAQSEKTKGIGTGRKLSEETKSKIKLARSKQIIPKRSEEHKKAISNALKGVPKKRESVEKQRQKILGRVQTEQERLNYLEALEKGKTTCSHCGKRTTKGNYRRWHGDNCKLSVNNILSLSDKKI
jgi:hypothetical protein